VLADDAEGGEEAHPGSRRLGRVMGFEEMIALLIRDPRPAVLD